MMYQMWRMALCTLMDILIVSFHYFDCLISKPFWLNYDSLVNHLLPELVVNIVANIVRPTRSCTQTLPACLFTPPIFSEFSADSLSSSDKLTKLMPLKDNGMPPPFPHRFEGSYSCSCEKLNIEVAVDTYPLLRQISCVLEWRIFLSSL